MDGPPKWRCFEFILITIASQTKFAREIGAIGGGDSMNSRRCEEAAIKTSQKAGKRSWQPSTSCPAKINRLASRGNGRLIADALDAPR
jgi:hypothetical protein